MTTEKLNTANELTKKILELESMINQLKSNEEKLDGINLEIRLATNERQKIVFSFYSEIYSEISKLAAKQTFEFLLINLHSELERTKLKFKEL